MHFQWHRKMPIIVKLFPKLCTCGNRLGSQQYKFEKEVERLLVTLDASDKGSPMRAQVQTMFNFGWNKMCCRNSTLNSSTYFIRDANVGAFREERAPAMKDSKLDGRRVITRDGPCAVAINAPAFPGLPGIETPMSQKKIIPVMVPVPALLPVSVVGPLQIVNAPPTVVSIRSRLSIQKAPPTSYGLMLPTQK